MQAIELTLNNKQYDVDFEGGLIPQFNDDDLYITKITDMEGKNVATTNEFYDALIEVLKENPELNHLNFGD